MQISILWWKSNIKEKNLYGLLKLVTINEGAAVKMGSTKLRRNKKWENIRNKQACYKHIPI